MSWLRRFICALTLAVAGAAALAAAPAMADGPQWGSPQNIGAYNKMVGSVSVKSIPFSVVSCPTESFCMAMDSGLLTAVASRYFTYDGTRWSGPQALSSAWNNSFLSETSSVSCTSATFCVAVDTSGQAMTWNGSSWSTPLVTPSVSLNSVSCVSSTDCVAVDDDGDWLVYDGATWTFEGQLAEYNYPAGTISCVSASFCVTTDTTSVGGETQFDNVTAQLYNGTGWTPPATIDGPTEYQEAAVSCASTTFCAAVDPSYDTTTDSAGPGDAMIFSESEPGGWGAPQAIDSKGLYTVSCPSASFCVAADGGVDVVTYNGTGWSSPQPVDVADKTFGDLSVSCASVSFCALVDSGGDVVMYETPPANTTAPTISGTASTGDKLTASTGAWSNNPNAYTYQWDDCGAGGTACTAIKGATAAVYTVGPGDIGHTIDVQVTAANGGGNGTAATARPTAVVPAPKAVLARIGPPSGGNAAISVILGHGGYSVRFTAVTGGILTIDWYAKTTVKRHKGKKIVSKTEKVLVAGARALIRAKQKTSVKVKLTKAGRKLLKKSEKLKITDVTTLKPTIGKTITHTSTFTLRR